MDSFVLEYPYHFKATWTSSIWSFYLSLFMLEGIIPSQEITSNPVPHHPGPGSIVQSLFWSFNLAYAMTIDTPLLLWPEEHWPATFLTVSHIMNLFCFFANALFSLQISKSGMIVQMLKIVLHHLTFHRYDKILTLKISLIQIFWAHLFNLLIELQLMED